MKGKDKFLNIFHDLEEEDQSRFIEELVKPIGILNLRWINSSIRDIREIKRAIWDLKNQWNPFKIVENADEDIVVYPLKWMAKYV